ncbi:hypothetical protein MNKW57_13660 [Biformimicrobium ophioploci]|uniref:Uncharacterized protein n=1 Tax=Biformimicrobium ophioploci TaxID=3036711 RepID=A0ABQ6LY93_9GAMM|nr:hypothetical protein MNKW57_13660 [Microbulbifer sp. NKW57]
MQWQLVTFKRAKVLQLGGKWQERAEKVLQLLVAPLQEVDLLIAQGLQGVMKRRVLPLARLTLEGYRAPEVGFFTEQCTELLETLEV